MRAPRRSYTVRAHTGFAIALALALTALAPHPARAAGELVVNPLLSAGTGDRPQGWTHEAYVDKPEAVRFTWSQDPIGIGALGIESLQRNDARWIQSVPVSPNTWYRVSGWIRTINVMPDQMGASLCVMGTFYNSRDLRGTQNWQSVGFWVKTGGLDTTLQLAARLGGYSALNTGTAYFTGISVEAAGTPPVGAPMVYGGDPAADSAGRPLWAQIAALFVVIGIALLLWRYLVPPATQIPP